MSLFHHAETIEFIGGRCSSIFGFFWQLLRNSHKVWQLVLEDVLDGLRVVNESLVELLSFDGQAILVDAQKGRFVKPLDLKFCEITLKTVTV